MKKRLIVVDPGSRIAEIESFNQIVNLSDFSCEYFLPALKGSEPLLKCDWQGVYGLIVFGSGTSVSDEPEWQRDLIQVLLKVIEKDIPVLAICYGHQLLAHMFAGEVNWARGCRTKLKEVRKTTVKAAGPFSGGVGGLVNSHNQVVSTLPACMESFAFSDEFQNEAMIHRSKPVFSFQAHVEATPAFLKNSQIENVAPESLQWGRQLLVQFLRFAAQK